MTPGNTIQPTDLNNQLVALRFHRLGRRGDRRRQPGLNGRRQRGAYRAGQAIQHHREEGRLFLIVVEVPGFQLRQLGGFGHRVVEVAEAVELDFKLTDVKTGLQTLRNYANTLLLAKHAGADNGLLRYETDNFLETVFDMIEIYSNELDRVAFYLLECDNPEELRAYEAEEKGE